MNRALPAKRKAKSPDSQKKASKMSRNPTMVSGIEIDQGNDAGTDESEHSYSVNVLAST